MKSKYSLVGLLVLSLFSFRKDDSYITVEYHAFLHSEYRSSSSSVIGAGHAYCIFTNNTSQYQQIGYYTVAPGENVSVGLWSSSAISESSSSSSSNIVSHSGVFYDYESVFYTSKETSTDEVYVSYQLDASRLGAVSDFIKSKNDIYNLTTYNCATFACDLWNHVSGSNYYTGWFRAPRQLRDDIIRDYPDYQTGTGSLTAKTEFAINDTNIKTLVWGRII